MHLKDYQKIVLYLYPRLPQLMRCAEEVAREKALASAYETATERCAEEIIGYIRLRDCLAVLGERAKRMFSALSEEEKFLLEYKFFRRGGRRAPALSERTYFRRQAKLAAKLRGLFILYGMDEGWFMRTLGEFGGVRGALELLREEGENAFADKRAGGALFPSRGKGSQKTSSVSS